MAEEKIDGFPPRWLSKVPEEDLRRSRGEDIADFAEALCKITKDSIAGHAGEDLVFRPWQRELTKQLFAVKADGTFRHRFFDIVDYPTAAALSFMLMAAILIMVMVYVRRAGTEELV